MKEYKRWIYSATEAPKIINNSEFAGYHAEGWQDSPAPFIKLEDMGIDKELTDAKDEQETAKAQQILDAVDGVVQSMNKQCNIDTMNKNQLESFIQDHYSVDLDKRKTIKELRRQAKDISGA